MARQWTLQQKNAIEARGGSVLVSAAAGSGKTAVLVERVIERITDKEKPTSVDRLLIVTFTKAAANEMKQRISAAIDEKLRESPSDANLINQKMLLPSAKICTIDSFCNSLVRENFQLLDISPDFKNADEGELNLIKNEALAVTLQEMYEKGSKDFLNLVELLFKGRDDSFLSEMIYALYNASVSYPFPEKWIEETAEKYNCTKGIKESSYGLLIFSYAEKALLYCLSLIESVEKGCEFDEELYEAFEGALTADKSEIKKMLLFAKEKNWDELYYASHNYKAARRKKIPSQYKDEPFCDILIEKRDRVKKIIADHIAAYMCSTEEEFLSDMAYLQPMVKELSEAVLLFSKNFSEMKSEKGLADFSDISHMALSLLVKYSKDGEYERTPLALSVAEGFDEILIDEYQDTNKAQDMLFTSISRNNLFRVGDVKQSIYRFRRAMPEIFIDLKNRYSLYDGEKDNYPAKIVLGNNFRSRKSVTGAVNFVFSQLMSEDVGDIEYGSEEELVFSAFYEEKKESAELHILDIDGYDKDEESSDDLQGAYVAELINKMISEGFKVKDGDGERPCRYSDFCILLRGVNGGRGADYAYQLKQRNIPSFTEVSATFFSSYEISLILSLLRVIDNPKQDIPLVTVLMSVLFGFSVDDIAALRINDRKSDIYGCLLTARKTEKVSAFLEKISYYRSLSAAMGVEDFIRLIYDDTSLYALVGAMNDSDTKKANLMLLLDYASTYEKAGYMGLSGFIGFIDRLQREKQDLPGSIGLSADANVVKIMTIHKSKGLEFPVCILSNCGVKFNRSDEKAGMIISSKEGIGLVARRTENLSQYPTVSHKAVKLSLKNDAVSEEMRVLYVAMTRAKEKLICVGAYKNVPSLIKKCAVNVNQEDKRVMPFGESLSSSYLEWLVTAYLRHKDGGLLRRQADLGEDTVIPSETDLEVFIKDFTTAQILTEESRKETVEEDGDFRALLEEKTSFKYKYEPLSYAVSKRAASEADENSIDRDYFASSKPAFLYENNLTAAQRGTATHSFMQYADYEKASISVKNEIGRICDMGFITENEARAINVKAVEEFFKSDFAKRILKSNTVMREKKFTVRVPICDIYPDLTEFSDETVVIQGIADCAFVENGRLVVVDYKTDNLRGEERFIEKYRKQVEVYKKALSMCTGYEVSEAYLYSFRLSKEIKVEV